MSLTPEAARTGDKALRDPENLVGRTVGGKYNVIEVLARGGMGRIYRAEQVPLGRPVALKVLHSELDEQGADPGFQKRFLLEAASCARLRHPNIVVVYDYGKLEETERAAYFMAMELVEGRTLTAVLKEEGRMPAARALRIAREVCRALREAHRQGMVHRDLKPSNVMLVPTPEGEQIKVLDFGLVKVMRDDSEELTKEGHFLGSPKYMAPEQIKKMPVDGRADLYALGVLLYHMLAGRVPFEGEQAVQTLMAHLTDPVPPLPAEIGAPPQVAAIVMRCLEKDPEQRFATADAFIQAVDEASMIVPGWSAQLPAGGSQETPSIGSLSGTWQATSRPAPRPSRRWAAPVAIALAATLAGLLAIVLPREATAPVAAPPPTTAPAPPVEPPAPELTPSPPGHFTMFVASTPPGARVRRGDALVGTTPTFVVLARDELLQAPVTFRLELDGYAPYVWSQGPSAEDVHVDAPLAALEAPEPQDRPTHRRPRPHEPETPAGQDFAIKTTR